METKGEHLNTCRYDKAVWWFKKTLAHIPSSLSEMWEPTVVNLAHAYGKLKYVYKSKYHSAFKILVFSNYMPILK